MELLHNRVAEIVFGPFFGSLRSTFIRGLRIKFDIGKTSQSKANTGKVEIYNMRRDNREKFQTGEVKVFLLYVGYRGNKPEERFFGNPSVPLLFSGDITRAFSYQDGKGNWITDVECGDGFDALASATLNESIKGNVSFAVLFDKLQASLVKSGIKVVQKFEDVKAELSKHVAKEGFVLDDVAKKLLDELLKVTPQFDWSVQDGELVVYDKNNPPNTSLELFSPATGLIGSPKVKKKGVEFRALIRGERMRPGTRIQLESAHMNGLYNTRKIDYSGDTHGNTWFMDITATEITQ